MYNHLQAYSIPDESWIFQWISTLFLYTFPLDFVVKVWDQIISKNLFFILQVSVQILTQFEKTIYNLEPDEFLDFFKNFSNNENHYK
jgi:hypothetical protein